MSRQAYYKQCTHAAKSDERAREALNFVTRVRLSHPRIGTRKLHKLMKADAGIQSCLGRDQLFALLREQRLLVSPKRAYHKTTQSHHRFRCHPNLLKPGPEQLMPDQPEQLWVADITYLPVQSGEAYLSLVTDAYSRKIVGYQVHDNLRAESVLQAYKQALKHRGQHEGELVHHSDRGIQYCSAQYQAVHQKYGVRCSMTDGYDCYQNALAERVNGILKQEYLLAKPKDIEEAKIMVQESIHLYNQKRPHLALNYKTPDDVHQAFYSK